MVCVAAFIVLAIVGIFVAVLSIFKRDIGRKYWKIFKKSWYCFSHRVTFRKCDTNFKDDVKNTILRKVVIKHPKAVKPLSVTIEIAAVLIVAVSVWSLAVSIKSGLALWTLGTCNVRRPAQCSLNSNIGCSIDGGDEPKNILESIGMWFTDWGEIFEAIPDKFKDWNQYFYSLQGISLANVSGPDKPIAVDIFDPGCEVCAISFRAQMESDFFVNNEVKLIPFAIQNEDGSYKFKNSEIVVRYLLAVDQQGLPLDEDDEYALPIAYKIISRIFIERNEDNKSYQFMFNEVYSPEEAEEKLLQWLKEFGYHSAERSEISMRAHSESVTEIMKQNNDIVVNQMHAKGIPTMIYKNHKHTGKYEAK